MPVDLTLLSDLFSKYSPYVQCTSLFSVRSSPLVLVFSKDRHDKWSWSEIGANENPIVPCLWVVKLKQSFCQNTVHRRGLLPFRGYKVKTRTKYLTSKYQDMEWFGITVVNVKQPTQYKEPALSWWYEHTAVQCLTVVLSNCMSWVCRLNCGLRPSVRLSVYLVLVMRS